MNPETDLTPGEDRRLARVLDSWRTTPAPRHLALSIMAAARPKAPSFRMTWPRMATLAAAACLGLIVGWSDTSEGYATRIDPGDALFAGDPLEGDIL